MLYIMRHGKTDWNALRLMQGRTDIPLNEEGRAMARAAREQLGGLRFDVCFCSPLQRALETATLLLEGTGTPIRTEERLVEMCFGASEGRVGYADNHDGGPMDILFNDPVHYVARDGAESFEALFARTGAFLRDTALPLSDAGRHVLIVAHGAVNCSIISALRQLPLSDFWTCLPGNCELTRLR